MASELNGTWKHARTWTRAGHRVIYLGVADGRAPVERNGFPYVTLLERRLPRGSVEDEAFYSRLERASAMRRLLAAHHRKRQMARVLDELLRHPHNEVEQALLRVQPDLVIVGTHCRYPTLFGLIAARLGICCAYLTQQMIQAARPAMDDAPAPTARDLATRVVAIGRLLLFNTANIDYPAYFHAFLDAARVPPESADYRSQRFPLRAPILYPWPSPFELPGVVYRNVVPIEAGVDLHRHDEGEVLEAIPRRSRLVYCSFGMLLALGLNPTRALLRMVIEAMRPLPDVQLVLALGPFFEVCEFPEPPANVFLCRRAPQMALLSRADAVITHGGSSTVRECLLLGVPIFVVPFGFESGEYAKRVSFHRIGLSGDHRTLTTAQVTQAVQQLLDDPNYRHQAARMRAALEQWERETPSCRVIDAVLATSGRTYESTTRDASGRQRPVGV
jgi:hypothetical protein